MSKSRSNQDRVTTGARGSSHSKQGISNSRSQVNRSFDVDQSLSHYSGPVQTWLRFWFTPTSPVGLHVIRVLGCLLLLTWLLPLAVHRDAFFGLNGWFDRTAFTQASELGETPIPLDRWSVFYLCGEDAALLGAAYWGCIAAIALFGLGIAPRLTGVITWVAVVSFTANPVIATDVDVLFIVLSFYLMVGYLLLHQRGPGQSMRARILGPTSETWLFRRRKDDESPSGSIGANVALRLLQLHVALVIVASGFHKLSIGDWWAGYGLWYPLHPPFETTFEQTLNSVRTFGPESYFFLLSLATYLMLAWQIAFPLFAWKKSYLFRGALLGGAAIGFLGSAFIYGQTLWGLALLICCLSFLSATEWQWLLSKVADAGRMLRGSEVRAAPEERTVKETVKV